MSRKQPPRAPADRTTSSADRRNTAFPFDVAIVKADSGHRISPTFAEAIAKRFSHRQWNTAFPFDVALVKAVRTGVAPPAKLLELMAAQVVRAALLEPGVLDGVSPERQQKLAELVLELRKAADVFWRGLSRSPWAKHGPGYIRKLTSKTNKTRAALEDLRGYVTKIRFPTRQLDRMKGIPFDDTLTAVLTLLDPTEIRRVGEGVISRLADLRASTQSKPTLAQATDALTAFFVNECGFGKYEADRRTALIGNTLWQWNITVDNEWTQGDSGARGSAAIRKRRTRQLRRDTSKKTR